MMKIRNIEEIMLGVALGSGYMTSLRFLGPIGFPEILVLVFVLFLFKKYYRQLFVFSTDLKGFIKAYLFLIFFLSATFMTFIQFFFNNINSMPIYLLNFWLAWTLCFLLVIAMKNGFNLKKMIFWFAIIFIITNLVTIVFFPLPTTHIFGDRYNGFAKNPNQLVFYATVLLVFLSLYHKKLLLFITPILLFIMLKVKSDDFSLFLFVVISSFIFFYIFNNNKLSFKLKLILDTLIIFIVILIIIINYKDQIINIWYLADEGGSRINLMKNALIVSINSPLFGYGIGSFSGIDHPFGSFEAHNTFLDFSMQFGLILSILIYSIFFAFFLKSLKYKDFLTASMILGFIVSSFFHFEGRHFVFWVLFAVSYYNVFYDSKLKRNIS